MLLRTWPDRNSIVSNLYLFCFCMSALNNHGLENLAPFRVVIHLRGNYKTKTSCDSLAHLLLCIELFTLFSSRLHWFTHTVFATGKIDDFAFVLATLNLKTLKLCKTGAKCK